MVRSSVSLHLHISVESSNFAANSMIMPRHSSSPIAFLFDLDGSLIDSERQYTRMWSVIEKIYPTGIPDYEHFIKGRTLVNILESFYPTDDIRQDIRKRLIKMEEEMTFGYTEGADMLLSELHKRGIAVALVTSSDEKKMSVVRQQMPELEERFDAIVLGDMVSRSKPDPEGYLLAAKMLGCPPERCAVVEDALQGLRAGHAAGCFVIGMSDTLGRAAVEPEADLTLDSLMQLDLDNIISILSGR